MWVLAYLHAGLEKELNLFILSDLHGCGISGFGDIFSVFCLFLHVSVIYMSLNMADVVSIWLLYFNCCFV